MELCRLFGGEAIYAGDDEEVLEVVGLVLPGKSQNKYIAFEEDTAEMMDTGVKGADVVYGGRTSSRAHWISSESIRYM